MNVENYHPEVEKAKKQSVVAWLRSKPTVLFFLILSTCALLFIGVAVYLLLATAPIEITQEFQEVLVPVEVVQNLQSQPPGVASSSPESIRETLGATSSESTSVMPDVVRNKL